MKEPAHTRQIARAAVRAELAQLALDLFRRKGFDHVTINDLADAAGVSRSTFLRYFASKEEAALGAVDAQGQEIADALRARPATEDDWTALLHAFRDAVGRYRQDPDGSLAVSRLICASPALLTRRLAKRHHWRQQLAATLAERAERAGRADRSGRADRPADGTDLRPAVLAAAAMDCLDIAIDRWAASEGRLDLTDLLAQAFAVLAPGRSGARSTEAPSAV